MSNPVLILARNNLHLTKRAITSVQAQDIPTELFIIDNDSRDGTGSWLSEQGINHATFRPQLGVSMGWNYGLRYLFRLHDYVLVINNDVLLPPWYYRGLLSAGVPFVTGISVDTMPTEPPERMPLVPHPDFSAFLITKRAWEEIGQFNVDMKFYAQDLDYHVRAHYAGIPLLQANLPFYHERSSTLNLASPEEQRAIQLQADSDRKVFRDIYGCGPNDPEYAELFK